MPQVILADKSDLFRRSLTSVLAREGYQVLPAETGAKALALAREARPVAILLDPDLEGPSGLETLEQLKADPLLRRTPVVMVSKDTTPRAVSQAYKLGAEGYLVKPIDLNALVKTLAQLYTPSPELNAPVAVALGEARFPGKLRFVDQYGMIYLEKAAGALEKAAGALEKAAEQSPDSLGPVGSLATISYQVAGNTYLQHVLLAEMNDQGLALFPAGAAVTQGAPELFQLSVNFKARYLLTGSFVRLADVSQLSAEGLTLRGLSSEPGFNAEVAVTLYPLTAGDGQDMGGFTMRGRIAGFVTQPDGLTDAEVIFSQPGGEPFVALLAELLSGRPPSYPERQEVPL